MATLNVTETPAVRGPGALPFDLAYVPELEKISCSFRGQLLIHPLKLMGKRIRFAELMLSEVGLSEGDAFESYISAATVLAVNIGSIEHGIQSSLLIQSQDGGDPYRVDISALTVLDVLQ